MAVNNAETIAVLGLGRMGAALAACLEEAGYDTLVWNRNSEKGKTFKRAAISPNEAFNEADLIIISICDYDATIEVLNSVDAQVIPGKHIVQTSSGTPGEARTLEAWVKQHDAHYLDAAILAYPQDIGGDNTPVFFSGEEAVFEAHADIFKTLAGASAYLGESVGAASLLDCALLQFFYAASLGALQGAAMCKSEGFPIESYVAALKSLIPFVEGSIDQIATRTTTGNYIDDTGAGASVAVHQAAIRHMGRLSRENQISAALPELIEATFAATSKAGYGGAELHAVFETLRRRLI
jgi:3-hydroxyisobutyrate dehydrogenase-like beta-hydroxyacid dehydrogenase